MTVYPLQKNDLAVALEKHLNRGEFPETMEVSNGKKAYVGRMRYSLDLVLQKKMEKLFHSYRPDFGAFVALDATTGAVLSIVSYTRDETLGNLNLKATFPAASVFKIVTSAAVLEQANLQPNSLIAFNGGYHTLYRKNVTGNQVNRWTRRITLKEAFAKSVNTVFGKLGIFALKPGQLEAYAERFQFNRNIASDLPVQPGTFVLDQENQWAIAEAASGFNRVALMSPVQGALIAASIINDGVMMEPFLIESVLGEGERPLYHVTPQPLSEVLSKDATVKMRELMRETVRTGTSRGAFRTLYRRRSDELEVGGKTGSLTGLYPKGKYDWFVGYATKGGRKIALAALTINEETWKVKSSVIARTFIEGYFPPPKVTRRYSD